MRVCIDTNALVQLFGRNVAGRPIRDALLTGRIELAVSNEILMEYEEAITLLSGRARWQQVERFLSLLFYLHANVLFIEPHFRFAVITPTRMTTSSAIAPLPGWPTTSLLRIAIFKC